MSPARGALELTPDYADDYVGWPLAPKKKAHGVYGTFLNPTTGWPTGMPPLRTGYHKAIDIIVNDAAGPRPVFAIEGGPVRESRHRVQTTPLGERVPAGYVTLGHFKYAHVVPEVEVGEQVSAGEAIGKTVPGWWHIHLEEWVTVGGKRIALNPSRPGSKLAPRAWGARPAIKAMRIYAKAQENEPSPRVIQPDRVQGVVVPVALAVDEAPLKEWPQAPVVPVHVYKASIELRRGGAIVRQRDLFRLDTAPGPTWRHFFRPLTRRSAPVAVCVVRRPQDCAGRFWLRLWEDGWDTRKVANGWYELTLTVENVVGRKASRTLRLRVAN